MRPGRSRNRTQVRVEETQRSEGLERRGEEHERRGTGFAIWHVVIKKKGDPEISPDAGATRLAGWLGPFGDGAAVRRGLRM